MNIQRVAVIGAGPSGLVAARTLRLENIEVVVYERNASVGGTWIYSPHTNAPFPLPGILGVNPDMGTLSPSSSYTAMYEHLHTNLPCKVMAFRDFPFSEKTPLFPHRSHVLAYLQQYAHEHQLERYIRFRTCVTDVGQISDHGWSVTSTSEDSEIPVVEQFDAVVVATGHYTVPNVPHIPGFDGSIPWLHSRDYRIPDPFANKTVLVMGGGSSGVDIVREVSKVATHVYHAIRSETSMSDQAKRHMAPNVQRLDPVQRYDPTNAQWYTANGDVGDIDVVIFATGYLYSFPFLSQEVASQLLDDGQTVHHLDHHLFYRHDWTLAFTGLLVRVVPFVISQAQAMVVARLWSGKIPWKASDDKSDNLVMDSRTEFDYTDSMNAWAEGNLTLDGWASKVPVTGKLTDTYRSMRYNALSLREQFLGY